MCGRYALYAPASQIAETFDLAPADLPDLSARYNIAPTSAVLGVHAYGGPTAERFRWGLIPFWADDPKKFGARMINARSETAHSSGAFKHAMAHRRLLVPASGFYEWEHRGDQKLPWFYRLQGDRVMALAGLWERWEGDGEEIRSCTILTTEANDLVEPVHDRMPVILPPAAWERWLDPDQRDPEAVRDLLHPYHGDDLVTWRVSQRVNRNDTEGEALVEPLDDA